jgi:hypothetical protein
MWHYWGMIVSIFIFLLSMDMIFLHGYKHSMHNHHIYSDLDGTCGGLSEWFFKTPSGRVPLPKSTSFCLKYRRGSNRRTFTLETIPLSPIVGQEFP